MGNSNSRQIFSSPSGIEIRPVYDPADVRFDPAVNLGAPGSYPFTRGVYPDMYRGRRWTMRQYAGFGTAEETNSRFRYLLEQGQTGLSVAFDLPTQMGLDSDDPRAEGEVGRVGVAIDTLDDMEVLFDRIPLGSVSTSMTINATAAVLLSMYVAVADARGIPRSELSGTVQNDILKEFVARGTYIYPVSPACGSLPTSSSSVQPRCRVGTAYRSADTTCAKPAARRCRRSHSPLAMPVNTSAARSIADWTSKDSLHVSASSSPRTTTCSKRWRNSGLPGGCGPA